MSILISKISKISATFVLTTALFSATDAFAAPDRTPPTRPTNLRETAKTSYSVSMAWNASTDNSGNFSYRVRHSWGYEATVPSSETSFTWTGNLEAGRSYSFSVYAIDAAGNRSSSSNTINVRLPADTAPPTTPSVSVLRVGPTYVELAWSSTDDGPFVWYTVTRDGTPIINQTSNTSAIITLLDPETTYTFTVRARDFGANWSPESTPIVVTTTANDPNDTTPPTMPGNLRTNGMVFEDGETWLFWDQSTDNVDPQAVIRYDVYLNGTLDHSTSGTGRTILYGIPGQPNRFDVIALDSAGNASQPATITTP
jgi:hypothetical protein